MTTTTRPGALVTGAGRGLGRGIAELLADRGYLVMVTDLDADTAASAAAEIGRGALSAVVDVREHEQVVAARDELIAAAGSLDVWVNNAGVLFTGPAWEQPEDLRRLHLDVNAVGTINGTVAAIDAMRGPDASAGAGPGARAGRGGHIINIASLAGLSAVPGEAVYAASKHAVMGFSSSTVADLRLAGVKNIDISCVCPDGIWTPMLYDKLEDPQAALSFSGVLLQPEDVLEAVGRVLDKPRPVMALPAWRGMIARLGAAFPRLGAAGMPLLAAQGRRVQRRLHSSQELPPTMTSGPVTTHRRPSPETRALYWGARATLRHVYRAWPLTEAGIRGLGAVERRFARVPHSPDVRVTTGDLGGVPVVTSAPAGRDDPADTAGAVEGLAVLYLHGGAFVFCGPDTHRRVCGGLAVGLGAPVHAVRYRTLPEVDLGAVVDDVYTAYRALSEQLPAGHRIAVAGDSAGGFLAAKICELAALDGIRSPAALVGYSPLFDLDSHLVDGPWLRRDAYQPASTVRRAQRLWARDPDRLRGERSMLEVDPAVFPPTFIATAAGELVEARALALTERLHAAGVPVETHRWYTTVHAFPVLSGLFPESRRARDLTVDFLRRVSG